MSRNGSYTVSALFLQSGSMRVPQLRRLLWGLGFGGLGLNA